MAQYMYVETRRREHRVWVDGGVRLSAERCNLDDGRKNRVSPEHGAKPRCKWCNTDG